MTIGFSLNLPYGWDRDTSARWFDSHAYGDISENKAWEWQTGYFGWTSIFGFDLDLIPTGSDHAKIGFSLVIFGFTIMFDIHDVRHWDYDNHAWEKYDEESIKERDKRWQSKKEAELERAYWLVAEDGKAQTKKSVEEFLESPQGQSLIEGKVNAKVKEKMAEEKTSKAAKAARGAEYRRQNGVENKSDKKED